MQKEWKYIINVEGGIPKIQNRRQFDADMAYIGSGKLVMTVKRYKAKRSLNQNSWYHGFIVPAVAQGLIDLGFERSVCGRETVHEMLKEKFLKQDVGNDDGLFITVTRSTTDLNKEEFGEYIDAIDRYCQEFLGFALPTPNTQQQIF